MRSIAFGVDDQDAGVLLPVRPRPKCAAQSAAREVLKVPVDPTTKTDNSGIENKMGK